MAEGDTIHRAARRLHDALAGREVRAASPSPRAALGGRIAALDGRRVDEVEARGKHLLMHFDGGLVLHSHMGMSGAWHLYAQGGDWRRPRNSAWVVLETDRAAAAMFGGSSVELLRSAEVRLHPRLSRLGPDILADDFTEARGLTALRRADRDRQLGDALLDQGVIAGIGNIFKSEGCWEAAVSPWRHLGELGNDDLERVVAATSGLMRAAVESGRQPKRVYRRSGEACPRCGAAIRSRGQGDANRATYWCPGCQA